jgi:aspartate racemase
MTKPLCQDPKPLGLIGGLGVRAGIYYYEKLVEAHEQHNAALRLFLAHADVRRCMGHVEAGETHELALYLTGLVQSLASAGAQVAVIPAVTPHICIAEVMAASPVPMVNILEAINADLYARRMRRVALFGTRFTIETNLFGGITAAEVVRPTGKEIDEIHHVYTNYAMSGVEATGHRDSLQRVAHALIEREGLDGIVLAGTDLSAFYDGRPPEYPAIDASAAHIAAIMRALLPSAATDPRSSRV